MLLDFSINYYFIIIIACGIISLFINDINKYLIILNLILFLLYLPIAFDFIYNLFLLNGFIKILFISVLILNVLLYIKKIVKIAYIILIVFIILGLRYNDFEYSGYGIKKILYDSPKYKIVKMKLINSKYDKQYICKRDVVYKKLFSGLLIKNVEYNMDIVNGTVIYKLKDYNDIIYLKTIDNDKIIYRIISSDKLSTNL